VPIYAHLILIPSFVQNLNKGFLKLINNVFFPTIVIWLLFQLILRHFHIVTVFLLKRKWHFFVFFCYYELRDHPNILHPPPPYGGGVQTSFLQTKARATAASSLNGSNDDDIAACLVFLVYLFAVFDSLLTSWYIQMMLCMIQINRRSSHCSERWNLLGNLSRSK
jgi:hypothetical protein